MLLTRKTDYALVALAGLAHLDRPSASARDLAAELHLPLPVLRNILKILAAHGLLVSARGPAGGYRLARPADEITLRQVVEVIEGPVQLARCCPTAGGEADGHCQIEDSCLIKGKVRLIHESLLEFLSGFTLAEIAPDRDGGPRSLSALAGGRTA